ncbi:unnamed protein product [Alternaria alternata]
MSHRVEGPERRSFAFHEVPQLRSDFDPVIQSGQESAANRLLGRDGQEQNADERTRASVSQHQFHPNDSFVYSDDGQSRSLPPDETTNKHLAQVGAHSVPFSEKAKEPVYWKGNTPWALTWEFLGIVVSICFLILGAFVVHLKDQQESAWSIKVLQATRIAPTLWPIFFSGVLGNAIRALADWRVERGIDLLALEQLMGSLTLAGSVQLNSIFDTATRVRPRLRALYSSALYDVASATQYVDKTNKTYQDIVITLGGESSAGVQAATDLWGNIRMPNLHTLPEFDANEPHRWVNVPWQDSVHNYSSLVGEHFAGLERNFTGNTTFNTTASYLTFSCSPWLNINGMKESNEWIFNKFQKNLSELINPPRTQGHLKVMIADIKTDEDVGKIAFVPAHAESRVRRRRWYQ